MPREKTVGTSFLSLELFDGFRWLLRVYNISLSKNDPSQPDGTMNSDTKLGIGYANYTGREGDTVFTEANTSEPKKSNSSRSLSEENAPLTLD
jgi:hypothetical protein